MDGNVPCFNVFSEENKDWHLEDLDLIQTRQLIFSNKPANSSNNRFADAVSTTEFEKRISDWIPKKIKNATNWEINVWVQWAEQRNCNTTTAMEDYTCVPVDIKRATKKRCIFSINDIDILKM